MLHTAVCVAYMYSVHEKIMVHCRVHVIRSTTGEPHHAFGVKRCGKPSPEPSNCPHIACSMQSGRTLAPEIFILAQNE